MLLRRFFIGLVLFCMGSAACGYCSSDEDGGLWLIQQDFVKFGKMDAYEKYKREVLEGFRKVSKSGPLCSYAQSEVDSSQYIYLTPVKDYSGLKDVMTNRNSYVSSLGANALLPFLSTLNFSIESLHRFLSDCSFLPKGKESIVAYGAVHYYLFGVMPPNERDFEEHLKKIAASQMGSDRPVCFRTWKMVIGADLPKYLVAVFASTEKEADKRAAELEFGSGPIKNILRSQKEGSCLLRSDLSLSHGEHVN